jgi:hypothetical protein
VTAAAFFQRSRQRQLHFRAVRRTDFSTKFVVVVGRVAVVLGFEQQIGARAALGDEPVIPSLRNSAPAASASELLGRLKYTLRKALAAFWRSPGCFIGAPDREFHIAAHRSAVFFEQSRCLGRAAFLQQRAA